MNFELDGESGWIGRTAMSSCGILARHCTSRQYRLWSNGRNILLASHVWMRAIYWSLDANTVLRSLGKTHAWWIQSQTPISNLKKMIFYVKIPLTADGVQLPFATAFFKASKADSLCTLSSGTVSSAGVPCDTYGSCIVVRQATIDDGAKKIVPAKLRPETF